MRAREDRTCSGSRPTVMLKHGILQREFLLFSVAIIVTVIAIVKVFSIFLIKLPNRYCAVTHYDMQTLSRRHPFIRLSVAALIN